MTHHDVFVSHSTKDAEAAKAVCHALESEKIRCWVAPRDIQPGETWSGAIVDAIAGAQLMLLIYSENSNLSKQVLREVERAVAKDIPILPFRISDTPLSKDMEYFLSTPHWLDALDGPLEEHLAVMTGTVQRILGRSPDGDSSKRRTDASGVTPRPALDSPSQARGISGRSTTDSASRTGEAHAEQFRRSAEDSAAKGRQVRFAEELLRLVALQHQKEAAQSPLWWLPPVVFAAGVAVTIFCFAYLIFKADGDVLPLSVDDSQHHDLIHQVTDKYPQLENENLRSPFVLWDNGPEVIYHEGTEYDTRNDALRGGWRMRSSIESIDSEWNEKFGSSLFDGDATLDDPPTYAAATFRSDLHQNWPRRPYMRPVVFLADDAGEYPAASARTTLENANAMLSELAEARLRSYGRWNMFVALTLFTLCAALAAGFVFWHRRRQQREAVVAADGLALEPARIAHEFPSETELLGGETALEDIRTVERFLPVFVEQFSIEEDVIARRKATATWTAFLLGLFAVHKVVLQQWGTAMLRWGLFIGAWWLVAAGEWRTGDNLVSDDGLLPLLVGGVLFLLGIVEGVIYLRCSNEQFLKRYLLGNRQWF